MRVMRASTGRVPSGPDVFLFERDTNGHYYGSDTGVTPLLPPQPTFSNPSTWISTWMVAKTGYFFTVYSDGPPRRSTVPGALERWNDRLRECAERRAR